METLQRENLPFTDTEMSQWMGADPSMYEGYTVVSFAQERPEWWNSVYTSAEHANEFRGGYVETQRGGWYILMGFHHD